MDPNATSTPAPEPKPKTLAEWSAEFDEVNAVIKQAEKRRKEINVEIRKLIGRK